MQYMPYAVAHTCLLFVFKSCRIEGMQYCYVLSSDQRTG